MGKINAMKLSCTKAAGRTGLLLKKYSPEILTGVGIVGVVGSAVLASKATLRLEEVVEETQDTLSNISKAMRESPKYTEKDALHDKTIAYTRGALAVVKLYGPALSLGMASIGCILAAHGIMKKRNAALVAAYKAVEESFNKYKQRVIEELGEDQERDIRFGIREEETKDGDKTEVKHYFADEEMSPYARFFDEHSSAWQKNAEYNLMYVKCQQNYANDLLKSRGHVFLNEVYDMLGLPHSQAGSVVGWISDSENGDNFIDFNIYDFTSDEARAFVNGEERSILLDFNVDGVIYDKI